MAESEVILMGGAPFAGTTTLPGDSLHSKDMGWWPSMTWAPPCVR